MYLYCLCIFSLISISIFDIRGNVNNWPLQGHAKFAKVANAEFDNYIQLQLF